MEASARTVSKILIALSALIGSLAAPSFAFAQAAGGETADEAVDDEPTEKEPPIFCAMPLSSPVQVTPEKRRYLIEYSSISDKGACPSLGENSDKPDRDIKGVALVFDDISLPPSADFTLTISNRAGKSIVLSEDDFSGRRTFTAPYAKNANRASFKFSGGALPTFTIRKVVRLTTEKERGEGFSPSSGTGFKFYSRLKDQVEKDRVLKEQIEPIREATVFLHYFYSEGPGHQDEEKCSGFLVGAREILTNRHCLNNFAYYVKRESTKFNTTGLPCSEIRIYFDIIKYADQAGEAPFVSCDTILKENVDQDWALLRLKMVPDGKNGLRSPLQRTSDADREEEAFVLFYHAGILFIGDDCKILRDERNEKMLDIVGEVISDKRDLKQPGSIVLHYCPTQPGASGSAVVLRQSRKIASLHFASALKKSFQLAKQKDKLRDAVFAADEKLELEVQTYNLSRDIGVVWKAIRPCLTDVNAQPKPCEGE